jgi:HAD superfamily hydrolase (TIGR01509 family)
MSDAVVRNVVFDMGGVVLEWNPQKILADFYADAPLRSRLHEALFLHPDWREFNRGDLQEAALLRRAALRSGRPLPELAALLDSMRESLVTKPETVELLRGLQGRGIALYCLSDMPLSVYRYLRQRHDFWDAFSGIVISAEVRLLKPEPAIYRHLLSSHGLDAARTVFIDDLPGNAAGARACGMHAIQFHDIEQVRRELSALLD